MALLNRDQILGANDLVTRDVDVPEWGGTVRIRMLTGEERDRFEASTVIVKNGQQKMNVENLRARLIALCVVDENGKLEFGSGADVRLLGKKSSPALQRVFNACQELNLVTDEDIEELAEGFDSSPAEGSPTA
jgi:hypothetical protein